MAKEIDLGNGFHIYGWMRKLLNLSGGELMTYAIVRQFSQDDAGVFTGGIPYIAGFVGCSLETARKYLHSLVAKGFIKPIDATKNGVRFVNYVADNQIPKKFGYYPKKDGGDTQKSLVGVPKKFGSEIEDKKENIQKEYTPLPPTVEQVEKYARSKGFADPRGFAEYYIDYQTENGWQTGKGKNRKPIDNWKLNVLAWLPNHKTHVFPKTKGQAAEMPLEQFNSMFQ